jgi:hypothetical protein
VNCYRTQAGNLAFKNASLSGIKPVFESSMLRTFQCIKKGKYLLNLSAKGNQGLAGFKKRLPQQTKHKWAEMPGCTPVSCNSSLNQIFRTRQDDGGRRRQSDTSSFRKVKQRRASHFNSQQSRGGVTTSTGREFTTHGKPPNKKKKKKWKPRNGNEVRGGEGGSRVVRRSGSRSRCECCSMLPLLMGAMAAGAPGRPCAAPTLPPRQGLGFWRSGAGRALRELAGKRRRWEARRGLDSPPTRMGSPSFGGEERRWCGISRARERDEGLEGEGEEETGGDGGRRGRWASVGVIRAGGPEKRFARAWGWVEPGQPHDGSFGCAPVTA